MLYPGIIQIETHRACQARCEFCTRSLPSFDFSLPKMPDVMIDSLLSEIESWKPSWAGAFCPFLNNEPFLDPRLGDICRRVNERLPNASIVIFTLGASFTPKMIESMRGVRLKDLSISLHSLSPGEYFKRTKMPLGETMESLERLMDAIKLGVFKVDRLSILRVPDGNFEADEDFTRTCSKRFPGIPNSVSYRYNWKGDIWSDQDAAKVRNSRCSRWDSVTILSDGRAALCCMDQNGQYPVGNAFNQSILDIFNGAEMTKYRQQTTRCLNPCNKCNMV